ncbi:MAG: 3-deoxy-D-manno-octulosonic acid transferase [Bacteroidetes bacterium]|nr:3-deoxy-D-manno-octulosonic acid transferase [Bacteroidota bacterium]
MIFFYQIFIQLFSFLVKVASLFNRKARLFVSGRKNVFWKLNAALSSSLVPRPPSLVWFHCSSLGEFEQARSLIDRIKNQESRIKILITFFSPSGYEIRKNYEGADFIFYLPIDTKSNARRFLDMVNPSQVFFVKYDFWYNYLHELKERNIPAYLVSANFRQEQFIGMYGKYLRKVLSFFNHIFVQNDFSQKLLSEQKILNVSVSGDLRYDRVSQTVSTVKKNQMVEMFKGDNKVVVCGSTWEKDEEIVSSIKYQASLPNTYYPILKLIIAPHEINEARIQSTIKQFSNKTILRFSEISKEPVSTALDKLKDAKVLIIDNIGMLSSLYQYADIAYIGGGFGSGIHNILEAVAFGAPVIFGPNHHKFPEAKEIIEQGGGFSIVDTNDFQKVMNLFLSDEKILMMASMVCKNFVMQRKGAVERIISALHLEN